MSLSLEISHFIPYIKLLLKANPEKYAHYDEVVNYLRGKVVNNPRGLVQAVAHLAVLYDQLSSLDERYIPGKARQVQGLEGLLDKTDEYLKQLDQLYPKAPMSNRLSSGEVVAAINDLDENPLTSRFKDVLALVDRYFAENADRYRGDLKTREQDAAVFLDALGQLLDRVEKPGAGHKFRQDFLYSAYARYSAEQTYVWLEDYLTLLGMDVYLGTRHDGQRVQFEYRRSSDPLNKEFSYYAQGEECSLANLLAVGIKLIRAFASPRELSNDAYQVFYPNELGSALVARAVSWEDSGKLDDALSKGPHDPNAQIRIIAIRLEAFTDQFAPRLHEAVYAGKVPSAVLNRQHRTFENEHQQNKLSEIDNGPQQVLTVRQPTASQDVFSLIGKLADGTQFVFYSPKTYTVVESDNTTRALDLTNANDRELVRELSAMREYRGNYARDDRPLTNDELQQLGQAVRRYDEFSAPILELFAQNPDTLSEDVTELFQQHYRFVRKPALEKPLPVPLRQHLKTAGGADASFAVQPVGMVDGKIVKGSERPQQSSQEPTTNKFVPAVKKLMMLDAQRYSQFDNVVEFLRENLAQNPGGLVQAVAHIAVIYSQLAARDSRYGAGRVNDVLGIEGLMTNTTHYLTELASLYPAA